MENNQNIIMWGEPFSYANIYDNMMDQFRSFTDKWPLSNHFFSHKQRGKLSDEWIANLYPDVDFLIMAHRQYFASLFAEQGRQIGRSQWGMKVVRLTGDNALYFRFLYPRCKILLLYRDPRDAYSSYRKLRTAWYRKWPTRPVATPYSFGKNWAEMTRSFLAQHREANALLVRYEDLNDSSAVKRIQDYLGWPVPLSSQLRRLGGGEVKDATHYAKIPRLERALLELSVGQTLRDAGYPTDYLPAATKSNRLFQNGD